MNADTTETLSGNMLKKQGSFVVERKYLEPLHCWYMLFEGMCQGHGHVKQMFVWEGHKTEPPKDLPSNFSFMVSSIRFTEEEIIKKAKERVSHPADKQ